MASPITTFTSYLTFEFTPYFAEFVGKLLRTTGDEWWQKAVLDKVPSHIYDLCVDPLASPSLKGFDLSGLLHIWCSNWKDVLQPVLPNDFREANSQIFGLRSIRNRYAHLSSNGVSADDFYRDVDKVYLLTKELNAPGALLDKIQSIRQVALEQLVPNRPPAESSPATPIQPQEPAPVPGGPKYAPGDEVILVSTSEILTVISVNTIGNEPQYGFRIQGQKRLYFESQLERYVEDPEGATSTVDDLKARLTGIQLLTTSTKTLKAMRTGKVDFLPYQYKPALKLIKADRPRMLIADEVGVGKTIEAGLIIKELQARMDVQSILIICPPALVSEEKWQIEMARFGETFDALDGPGLGACLSRVKHGMGWPENRKKAILSYSLFNKKLIDKLDKLDEPLKFDLVIVDEAHYIQNPTTDNYACVRYFTDNAEAVLLLSATPIQLRTENLFTLLNVLRDDLVIDMPTFNGMAAPNPHIGKAVAACRNNQTDWEIEALSHLREAARTDWGRSWLGKSAAFQEVCEALESPEIDQQSRVSLMHQIQDLYTFSGLINRTRRRDIGKFSTRKADAPAHEFTPEQRRLYDEVMQFVVELMQKFGATTSVAFVTTNLRRRAASSLHGLAPFLHGILHGQINRLELMETDSASIDQPFAFLGNTRDRANEIIRLGENLPMEDPKFDAFLMVLLDKSELPNNKALVFSTFRHTLSYLEKRLKNQGLRVGVVHGEIPARNQPGVDRVSIRKRFSLPASEPDAIDVLLSSEVGCEGLDYQFCDMLINYDLPWNPMKLEQRIGRIDRYGQKSDVIRIINMVTPDTIDYDIYDRCLLRIGIFEDAIGGTEVILGELTKKIENIANDFTLTPEQQREKLKTMMDAQETAAINNKALEANQAEFLALDVTPANMAGERQREINDEIAAATSTWFESAYIRLLLSQYLASILNCDCQAIQLPGTEGEGPLLTAGLREELSRQQNLSDRTRRELSKGKPYTFNQAWAAENPDTNYLATDHPLVVRAAEWASLQPDCNLSLCVHSNDLEPGNYPFAIYRWTKSGVKPDEEVMVISTNSQLPDKLPELIETAVDQQAPILSADGRQILETLHHRAWSDARANHVAMTREQVDLKVQALNSSHQANIAALENQIRLANNPQITRMRTSQIQRAKQNHERNIARLMSCTQTGDITINPIAFGMVTVEAA